MSTSRLPARAVLLIAAMLVVAIAASGCTTSSDTSTTTTDPGAESTGSTVADSTTSTTTASATTTTSAPDTTTTTTTQPAEETTTTTVASTTTAPTTTAPTTTTTVPEGNEQPTVAITAPAHLSAHAAAFDDGQQDFGAWVTLTASAEDPNGDLLVVSWSSTTEGEMGTGQSVTVWFSTKGSDATQPVITATATDQWGAGSSDTIQIIVWIPSDT